MKKFFFCLFFGFSVCILGLTVTFYGASLGGSCVLIIFYSVGKLVALFELFLGMYGTHKATTSVFSFQPPRLFSSPSLLPPLCGDVIISPLSSSDLRASVHSVRAWWVFGDYVAIWASLCRILCGTIHGQRLQMNASIHKYSLSISRSPWCLVVFSCSLRGGEKRQLKWDKNTLKHEWFTWKIKRETTGSGVFGPHVLSLNNHSQTSFLWIVFFLLLHSIKLRISSRTLRFRRF